MSHARAHALDPEALLSHMGWMRGLAVRLLDDRHLAEDAVHDTIVKALEKAPQDDALLGPWLNRVLWNNIRHKWRDARTARKHVRPDVEVEELGLEGIDPVVQAEAQREIMDVLVGLDEPYRTTMILRWVRERSNREIAAEQGVPESTVRTRLERGLKRVRGRLQARFGEDWQVACIAILGFGLPGVPVPPVVPVEPAAAPAADAPTTSPTAVEPAAAVADAARPGIALSWKAAAAAGLLVAGTAVGIVLWQGPGGTSSDSTITATPPPGGAYAHFDGSGGASRANAERGGGGGPPPAPPAGPTGNQVYAVDVRAVDPGGALLWSAALVDRDEFSVVALDSNSNLPANLPQVAGREGDLFGVAAEFARIRGAAPQLNMPMPPDVLGRMLLRTPPPLNVGLYYGGTLLGTEVLGVGTPSLTFQVSANRVRALQGGVRFRLVDGANGGPVFDCEARLEGPSGTFRVPDPPVSVTGDWLVQDLIEGRYRLRVDCPNRASLLRAFSVVKGQTIDLGTLAMPVSVPVTGRIRDALGTAAGAQGVGVGFVDLLDPDHLEFFHDRGVTTEADGSFRFDRLPPSRYVLWLRKGPASGAEKIAPTPVVVDTRLGPVTGLQLQTDRGTRVIFDPQFHNLQTRWITVRDAAGLPVWADRLVARQAKDTRLSQGTYTIEIGPTPGSVTRTEVLTVGGDAIVVDIQP